MAQVVCNVGRPTKYADMVGNKYNYLTVLSLGSVKNTHQNIICKCDCGNITEKRASQVYNDITVSCGCKRIVYNEERIEEITGKTYQRLTVLGFAYRSNKYGTYLKVKCNACEREVIRRAVHVLFGKIYSCGCLQYSKKK